MTYTNNLCPTGNPWELEVVDSSRLLSSRIKPDFQICKWSRIVEEYCHAGEGQQQIKVLQWDPIISENIQICVALAI
jgi:hypothetical protein